MITRGKEYKARGDDAKQRGIQTRRVSYVTAAAPTPEQKTLIEKIERGVVDGEWEGNPYSLMRTAEYRGIDFYEEEKRADGKWYLVNTGDEQMALMQTGAL